MMNVSKGGQARSPLGWIALGVLVSSAAQAEDEEGGHQHGGEWAHKPIEEVTVTATVLDNSIAEITQGVTVLEGDELRRVISNSIGETLALQPGVTASYFGPGSSRPIIRGLAGARVRVMEDAISTLDVSTLSVDHAVAVEPLLVDRVEVLRGPATLAYGSGAIGGVVNTVTTRLPTSLPEDRFDGRFELRGDTVSEERTAAFGLNAATGRLVWHVDGLARETDDYRIPGFASVDGPEIDEDGDVEGEEGVLENSDIETNAFAGGLSWIGESVYAGFAVSVFNTNYGIPTSEEEEDDDTGVKKGQVAPLGGGDEIVRIDLEQTRYDFKAGWNAANGGFLESIIFRAAYNDYEHAELEGDEVGTQFDNDAFEGRLEVRHAAIGAWEGAFGLQVETREFSAIGEEAFVPPVDTTSFGAFIVEEGSFGNWRASLGGRVETQDQDPSEGPSVSDTAYSLSTGLVRFVGESDSVLLNLSLAQRLPAAEELFSDGPHLATGTFEIGDPTLGVETSQHVELGWRHDDGRFSAAVAGFYTRFDDYIYLLPTGGVEDGLPVFQWTQADAEFMGLEAEFGATVANIGRGEFDVRVFGDVVSGELTEGGNLPQISPARLGARLEYHDNRFAIGLDSTYVFEQDQVAEFETTTDGYTMLNADFSWAVAVGGNVELDLFVRANNLLDQEARRHVSFVKDVAPLPGRGFSFGVRGLF
jgi:iron complex outermembrane receptor protein